jgi:S-adenosylmethionine decarboxylase
MLYKQGLHILAKLTNCNKKAIENYSVVKQAIDLFIIQYNLQNLGEVYHQFANGGYTAVVCLSESHLSIHTWPEFDIVNVDIYLSNHLRNNENIVVLFIEKIVATMKATVLEKHTIIR